MQNCIKDDCKLSNVEPIAFLGWANVEAITTRVAEIYLG